MKPQVLFLKTHIEGYSKKSGAFVAAHEDKRPSYGANDDEGGSNEALPTIMVKYKDKEDTVKNTHQLNELFPTWNTPLSKEIDYIEITAPGGHVIRARSTFLLSTADNKWYVDVPYKGEYRKWNGVIYAGNTIYLDGKKINISNTIDKYKGIIEAREKIIEAYRRERA